MRTYRICRPDYMVRKRFPARRKWQNRLNDSLVRIAFCVIADRCKDVLKLNLRLKELSEKENIVFIDLNKVLSENGKLNESYSSKDDIHLNGDGYSVWKNSIKKYVK